MTAATLKETSKQPRKDREGLTQKSTASFVPVWEEIGIENDFLFGKVMENKELCMEFLHLVLPGVDILDISYPELQKSLQPTVDAHGVRLDVYVNDEAGTIYNIEMQTADTKELLKRCRYYQGVIDLQMLSQGDSYNDLTDSYVIFICPFDLFGKGRYQYTFRNYCEEERKLPLGDGATKIFLNAKGTVDDVSPGLKAFLDYVAGGEASDPYTEALAKEVARAKMIKEWEMAYKSIAAKTADAKKKGREEGIEEGREEGRLEGIREGMENGILKGREEGERSMTHLTQILLSEKRYDDLQRCTCDPAYRSELYRKYGIPG